MKKNYQLQGGATLVEVLIAILILSIGLLGIAGLQLATAKFKLGSTTRAATAVLYSDFADRVRMNPAMAGPNSLQGIADSAITSSDLDQSKYTYQASWATQQAVTDSSLSSSITTATTACEGSSSACSPTQRATYDMLTWRKRVRESLPQGAVYVAGNISTGIDVTLMWMDKDNTDKNMRVNNGTQVSLIAASSCSSITVSTGLSLQNCCPDNAAVPAGVRCNRFSFTP